MVLFVDDNVSGMEMLLLELEILGIESEIVPNEQKFFLSLENKLKQYSVIVMDYNLMSKRNGIELISIAKDKYKNKIRNVKIILFSGNSNYICESELEVLARNNVEIVSKSNYGILIEKLQIEANKC